MVIPPRHRIYQGERTMEKHSTESGGVFSHLKQELTGEISPVDLHKPAAATESMKPTPADYVRAYIAEAVDAFIP